MATRPGPHRLDDVRLIFGPKHEATTKAVTPSFYEDLSTQFSGFKDHILVSRHHFAAPWPSWEMHPNGDELVYLVAGSTDLVLHTDGGEQVIRVDEPGTYVVIPKGTWHTARPLTATTMLFFTPGEGTVNADRPG